ncbi:hypothetical protein AB1Y20_022094 [Prymnesium parvum]|uniref:Cilia- and flagella-associated protein 157 n=1 Tax=Prymnesium parvum TaxID=97485 RepID=A0AB34JII1_PRYPA
MAAPAGPLLLAASTFASDPTAASTAGTLCSTPTSLTAVSESEHSSPSSPETSPVASPRTCQADSNAPPRRLHPSSSEPSRKLTVPSRRGSLEEPKPAASAARRQFPVTQFTRGARPVTSSASLPHPSRSADASPAATSRALQPGSAVPPRRLRPSSSEPYRKEANISRRPASATLQSSALHSTRSLATLPSSSATPRPSSSTKPLHSRSSGRPPCLCYAHSILFPDSEPSKPPDLLSAAAASQLSENVRREIWGETSSLAHELDVLRITASQKQAELDVMTRTLEAARKNIAQKDEQQQDAGARFEQIQQAITEAEGQVDYETFMGQTYELMLARLDAQHKEKFKTTTDLRHEYEHTRDECTEMLLVSKLARTFQRAMEAELSRHKQQQHQPVTSKVGPAWRQLERKVLAESLLTTVAKELMLKEAAIKGNQFKECTLPSAPPHPPLPPISPSLSRQILREHGQLDNVDYSNDDAVISAPDPGDDSVKSQRLRARKYLVLRKYALESKIELMRGVHREHSAVLQDLCLEFEHEADVSKEAAVVELEQRLHAKEERVAREKANLHNILSSKHALQQALAHMLSLTAPLSGRVHHHSEHRLKHQRSHDEADELTFHLDEIAARLDVVLPADRRGSVKAFRQAPLVHREKTRGSGADAAMSDAGVDVHREAQEGEELRSLDLALGGSEEAEQASAHAPSGEAPPASGSHAEVNLMMSPSTNGVQPLEGMSNMRVVLNESQREESSEDSDSDGAMSPRVLTREELKYLTRERVLEAGKRPFARRERKWMPWQRTESNNKSSSSFASSLDRGKVDASNSSVASSRSARGTRTAAPVRRLRRAGLPELEQLWDSVDENDCIDASARKDVEAPRGDPAAKKETTTRRIPPPATAAIKASSRCQQRPCSAKPAAKLSAEEGPTQRVVKQRRPCSAKPATKLSAEEGPKQRVVTLRAAPTQGFAGDDPPHDTPVQDASTPANSPKQSSATDSPKERMRRPPSFSGIRGKDVYRAHGVIVTQTKPTNWATTLSAKLDAMEAELWDGGGPAKMPPSPQNSRSSP